jgi:nitroreductase
VGTTDEGNGAVIEVETSERAADTGPIGTLDAIRTRRSVGRMRPERPPRAAIETIVEAATLAPNHRLTEPWRFFVLAGEARRALGRAIADAQATPRPDGAADSSAAYAAAAAKPLRAPVVIAVAVEPATGPQVVEIEEVAAGAAAVQNMLLAAHALGLAAIWRTGAPAYHPAVKAFFGLSPEAHLLGFVYVGYPDAAPPERTRRPAAEVTRWLGWEDEAGDGSR